METFSEYQWVEKLSHVDRLIVRLYVNHSFTTIRSFAIIQTQVRGGKEVEIVKVDGSGNEHIHIHYFFKIPPKKEYHSRPVNLETIEHYIDFLRINWRWYLSQYDENHI